jgi:hypothetical protein
MREAHGAEARADERKELLSFFPPPTHSHNPTTQALNLTSSPPFHLRASSCDGMEDDLDLAGPSSHGLASTTTPAKKTKTKAKTKAKTTGKAGKAAKAKARPASASSSSSATGTMRGAGGLDGPLPMEDEGDEGSGPTSSSSSSSSSSSAAPMEPELKRSKKHGGGHGPNPVRPLHSSSSTFVVQAASPHPPFSLPTPSPTARLRQPPRRLVRCVARPEVARHHQPPGAHPRHRLLCDRGRGGRGVRRRGPAPSRRAGPPQLPARGRAVGHGPLPLPRHLVAAQVREVGGPPETRRADALRGRLRGGG